MTRVAVGIVLVLVLSNVVFGQIKLKKIVKKIDKSVHKGFKKGEKIGKKSEKEGTKIYREVKRDLSPFVKMVSIEAREVFEIGEREVGKADKVVAKRRRQLQKSIDNDSLTPQERKELEKRIRAVEKQRNKLVKAIKEEAEELGE